MYLAEHPLKEVIIILTTPIIQSFKNPNTYMYFHSNLWIFQGY